jgi:hypothetical protein
VSANGRSDLLFDSFVDAYARGESPDVTDFLEQAGQAREQLGRMLDGYLAVAPVTESTPEELALVRAGLAGTTPLTAARAGLGLPIDTVVERLRRALGLRESLRERLRRAYQELEREALPPARVHDSVWNALRDILRVDARRLANGRWSAPERQPGHEREGAGAEPRVSAPATRDPDEVDLLFRGAGLR